jgi:hypothetical protein
MYRLISWAPGLLEAAEWQEERVSTLWQAGLRTQSLALNTIRSSRDNFAGNQCLSILQVLCYSQQERASMVITDLDNLP